MSDPFPSSRPAWRKYADYAFLVIIGQSVALLVTAYILQQYVTHILGNHLAWKDAVVLLPLLPGFLVLGVVTLTIMDHYPLSMDKAATITRVYLLLAAMLAWWLIESPSFGWSVWAAIMASFAATYARFRK